jgi:hypothetical protein
MGPLGWTKELGLVTIGYALDDFMTLLHLTDQFCGWPEYVLFAPSSKAVVCSPHLESFENGPSHKERSRCSFFFQDITKALSNKRRSNFSSSS